MTSAILNLDATTLTFGPNGIDCFSFPLSRAELVSMERAMTSTMAGLARSLPRDEPASAGLGAVSKAIVLDALPCFYADVLARRVGGPIAPPKASRVVGAIVSGCEPDDPPGLGSLTRGIPEPAWRRLGRPFKSFLTNPPIKAVWPMFLGADDVCAIATSPLIVHQQDVLRERLGLVPASWWFRKPLSEADIRAGDGVLVEEFVDQAVNAAYEAVGEAGPSPAVASYLRRTSGRAVQLAAAWCRRFDQMHRSLPRRLWTGTGGDTWARLVRSAVRRHGGTVRGHDHGSGGGHVSMPHYSYNEFFECDEFFTFTDAQARGVQEFNVYPEFLFEDHVPAIRAASNWHLPIPTTNLPRGGRDRAVVHVGMPLQGENFVTTPLVPDYVLLDWYGRLFAQLSQLGYRVIHKAYPSTTTVPVVEGLERMGVEIERRPFEQAICEGDILLFDHASTTTFGHALRSTLPVVLVDFDVLPFNEVARDKLERRCSLVPGSFDQRGRATVDWDALRDGLERAVDLKDRSYPVEYYGTSE